MSLTKLLAEAQAELSRLSAEEPIASSGIPGSEYVVFFSLGNRGARARVHIAKGQSIEQAWANGTQVLQAWIEQEQLKPEYLCVDVVSEVRAMAWSALNELFARTKRNYFRFGLALAEDFSIAFLEQELAANALLYDTKVGMATPNAVNLRHYSKIRFGQALQWPSQPNATVWRFKTRAVFAGAQGAVRIEHQGPNRGYRVVENWGAEKVGQVIEASTAYLARQVQETGQYHYGWFPCFDRAIPTYNALRHASSTYAMLEGWELTQDAEQEQAVKRALEYLTQHLIKEVKLPDGQEAAFLVDLGDEIKLGGNAVCLLAFSKYTEITGDKKYLGLAEKLAVGVLHMQNPKDGSFVHVLNYPSLSLKARHRIIYYDGEAAFGLMRLYGISKDERWLNAVVHAFDYFIEAKHWEAHDHWLSYCVNELTLYKPEEKYYQFGLDNVRDHLDFVTHRITTFPTLLELMMAAQRMIVRIQQDPSKQHLLQNFDLEKFYVALETRARYLLSGFFWPELAMFFKNPGRILDGFFIRHHGFRVRIDDVEHYLSGYVAYKAYLAKGGAPDNGGGITPASSQPVLSSSKGTDPSSVGLLMYPRSPKDFPEVEVLAEKAGRLGLKVFYVSYSTARIEDGTLNGYAFREGEWKKARFDIPAVIDNAPPRTPEEESLFKQLAAMSFLTCQTLGGKKKIEGFLRADPSTREWLIPSVGLSLENLRLALRTQDKVIIKPYRSHRGQGVFLLEKLSNGAILVRTNESATRMGEEEFEDFVAQRSSATWMMQKYVASVTPDGHAYDIRVPLFRATGGRWHTARMYARQGAGNITSNLAAGGSNYEACRFLAEIYGESAAQQLAQLLAQAASQIAVVLQRNYPFLIDALGCDFGIVNGRPYLFEVNAYPGLKGCLESATDLKVGYYTAVLGKLQTSQAKSGNPFLFGNESATLPSSGQVPRLTPPSGVKAATEANRALLQQVIAKGENDYSRSPLLKPSIGNPVYRLIANEARRRGYKSRIVSNTHLEVRNENGGLLAVFSPNSPNLSFATGMATQNKESTRRLLQGAGLPTPAGKAFRDKAEALRYFRSRPGPQVVKPLRGSGGVGVTVNVATTEQFDLAWDSAQGGKKSVVVEDFFEGDELRLIVLGGETVAAVCRMPAYVVGDGVSTIAQLVEHKNEGRSNNPLMRRYPIARFDYLQSQLGQTVDAIPKLHECVQLSSVSNVAQGGEAVSLMDVLHPSFLVLAQRAFDAFPGATQIGLDVIAKNFGADAFADNAIIIEVNSDPAVGTPCYAAYGPPSADLPTKLLDFVEKSPTAVTAKAKPDVSASLAPAPIFEPSHNADKPFPRSYRLQGRLLCDAAVARGLEAQRLTADITLISGRGKRSLFCFGMSHATLRAARRASNDKELTKRLLREEGVITPSGDVFAVEHADQAWAFALDCGLPVVIKPLVGSGGKGVFTNILSRADFDVAWQAAGQAGARQVIVEPHIAGNDYRLFVVQNALVAVARREPAYVVGDGVSTIKELMEQKNIVREGNPHHGAKLLVLTDLILRNLRQAGLSEDSVLEGGRRLELHTVANIGLGGESIDETDRVHPAWAEIAVRTRRAVFDAYHAGVDLIAEDIARAPDEQRWAIIEVNTNPDFGANHFPMRGPGRDVAGVLLESLFAD